MHWCMQHSKHCWTPWVTRSLIIQMPLQHLINETAKKQATKKWYQQAQWNEKNKWLAETINGWGRNSQAPLLVRLLKQPNNAWLLLEKDWRGTPRKRSNDTPTESPLQMSQRYAQCYNVTADIFNNWSYSRRKQRCSGKVNGIKMQHTMIRQCGLKTWEIIMQATNS